MNKYVALYKQGQMAWINAIDLVDAANKAKALEEREQEVPKPPKRFEEYRKCDWSETISVRESDEYKKWKLDKQRIESYNKGRRMNLYCVKEFMFSKNIKKN